jgi:hypothetical protein
VPHVELSFPGLAGPHPHSEPAAEGVVGSAPQGGVSSAGYWSEAVTKASEPCVLLDPNAVIVSMSASCARLLGFETPPTGRALLDGVLRLLDFSADAGALADNEIGKIPPLLALSSGRLARGLIRVQCGDVACTLDGIATPIGEDGAIAGSLTFFSRV